MTVHSKKSKKSFTWYSLVPNRGRVLGRANQTSKSEDPKPQPQKLRFFEAEVRVFKKN